MSEHEVSTTALKKRTLELDAFSSLIDALRASGPLTQERKALLQQTATSLKIAPDRYKAEIRRALAKPNLNGEQDETLWAIEGRRDTFMLPRKAPQSTMAAPYSAYTTRLRPALVKLPAAPYKSVETQTVQPKPASNPKLVVVSSPRSQSTHTMVYAKASGQRQVRISPQSGQTVPIVVNSKGQSKMVSMPTVVKPNATMTPVNAQKVSQHLVVNSPTQHGKQIVITTPNNIVHKISARGVTQTVQVRPTVGTPVVTKVVNPNRSGELKIIQKPRVAQVRAAAPGTQLTPVGVRLCTTNGKHPRDRVDEGLPASKTIKSGTQWNYDDHSVMAKPAAIAPSGKPVDQETTISETNSTSTTTPLQTKTVQIVQMSTTNAQNVVQTQSRTTKPVRMVTPTQLSQKGRESKATNVVVQSLPYPNYQGSFLKMAPEEVIIEEEVA